MLRRVAGVNVTELEASKGRNSIATKKRREEYLEEQSTKQASLQNAELRDRQVLMNALAQLEQRGVSALEEKLSINRQITNQKSLQAQKERDAQLQGQSMRIPTPYTNAAGQGFPGVALPQTKQEAKIAAVERARAENQVALARQKANSILAEDVTLLKTQLLTAEKLGAQYEKFVQTLQKANKRQSQLFRATKNRETRKDLGSKNLELARRVEALATNRLLKEQLINKTLEIGVAIRKNEFTKVKQLTNEVENLLEIENKRIDSAQRLLKFKQKQRKADAGKGKGGGGMGGLGAGIGFPLLFGAGPGSVIGGAVGSLTGGFGAQILLSAIGGIIDQTVAKIAQLGQALNPLTANLDTVLQAAGETDTAFGQLAKQLEEVAGKEKALEMATAQLATVIGNDGVATLREFGEETTELGNTLSEALSQASVAVVQIVKALNLLEGTTGVVEDFVLRGIARENTTDPELQRLKQEKTSTILKGVFNPFGNFDGTTVQERVAELDAAIIARAKILKLEQETTVQKKTQAEINAANQKIIDADVRLKAAQKAVVETGGSLLEDEAYKAREALIIEQAQQKIDKAVELNDVTALGAAITQKDLDLAKLNSERAKELLSSKEKATREAEKAAREAERAGKEAERTLEKQLALARKIANAQAAADTAELINKEQVKFNMTPFSRPSAEEIGQSKMNILTLNYAREKSDINNEDISTQERAAKLREAAAKYELAQLNINKEYNQVLKTRAEDQAKLFEGAELERDLALAKTDTAKFELQLASEVLDLRRSNLKLTDDQIKAYKALKTATFEALNPSPLKAYMDQLEENLYGVDAVEKQIVKMSQTVAAELGSGLASAITGVIDGTKSVEEAFSEMFANIGQSFIQMATEMLAQKAIFALLKAIQGPTPSMNTGIPLNGRASGGAVASDRPYMVGETGPELFIPQTSGRVINNSDTMDRYSYQDNAPVQPSQPIKIEYTSRSLGGEEYVTTAQFQQGMAAAAKQGAKSGETRVMASLRNSRSRRKSVGI